MRVLTPLYSKSCFVTLETRLMRSSIFLRNISKELFFFYETFGKIQISEQSDPQLLTHSRPTTISLLFRNSQKISLKSFVIVLLYLLPWFVCAIFYCMERFRLIYFFMFHRFLESLNFVYYSPKYFLCSFDYTIWYLSAIV